MAAYATAADLTGWLPADGSVTVPAGAEAARLLDRASELVEEYAVSGWTVDDTGAAVDAEVVTALKNAVCAQVEQWLSVGEDNAIDGYPAGTAVVTKALSVSMRPQRLGPRARAALAKAGLTQARGW
ncbi:MAG TPA: hypothetical protein VFV01_47730 [Spirillospora sp.]|nr:hypothetical protein [Spirillospora sp.]